MAAWIQKHGDTIQEDSRQMLEDYMQERDHSPSSQNRGQSCPPSALSRARPPPSTQDSPGDSTEGQATIETDDILQAPMQQLPNAPVLPDLSELEQIMSFSQQDILHWQIGCQRVPPRASMDAVERAMSWLSHLTRHETQLVRESALLFTLLSCSPC